MLKTVRYAAVVVLVGVSPVLGVGPPGSAVDLASVQLDAQRLRVHFIDVGPGLAVLIETPGNDCRVFVDGGKWGLNQMMAYVNHFVPANQSIEIAIPCDFEPERVVVDPDVLVLQRGRKRAVHRF